MFKIDRWLLASLIFATGEIAVISSSNAQVLNHDTSSIPTNQSLVDTSVPTNVVNGSLDSDTGVFTVEGLGNGITLPPDVIQSIQDVSGVTGTNSISNNDGATGNTGVARRDTVSGDVDTIGADSSNNITICFSDPCIPAGESTKAVTLNELADLMENDLQQSLEKLAAAEAVEKKVGAQPRRFVRRRSTDCIAPSIQARQTVETKLEESQKFIEQVEQLNPNRNIW